MTKKTMTTKPSESEDGVRLPIDGNTYPATKKGFTKMLAEANIKFTEGYQLHSVVRLENAIAVVFVLNGLAPGRNVKYASFLGEDEDDPIPTYR